MDPVLGDVTFGARDRAGAIGLLESVLGGRSVQAADVEIAGLPFRLADEGGVRLTWRVADLAAFAERLRTLGVPFDEEDGALVPDPAAIYGLDVRFRAGEAGTRSGTILSRLHHITVAVPDGPPAYQRLSSVFGGEPREAALYGDFWGGGIDGPDLGIIWADRPESFVARFLAERGPGIHHLAFAVEDMEAALAAARERGVRLVNPRPPAGPIEDVFLHPSNPTGTLLRLTRYPRSGAH